MDPFGVVTDVIAGLPSWLSFNGNNSQQVFLGVPIFSDVEQFVIHLICTGTGVAP